MVSRSSQQLKVSATNSEQFNGYSKREDFLNASSHGLGVLLSIIGLILMILATWQDSNPLKLISAVLYGTSMILLFLTSTVYHSLKDKQQKKYWKILDHCAIYLLIAGTYTPYLLVSFDGY